MKKLITLIAAFSLAANAFDLSHDINLELMQSIEAADIENVEEALLNGADINFVDATTNDSPITLALRLLKEDAVTLYGSESRSGMWWLYEAQYEPVKLELEILTSSFLLAIVPFCILDNLPEIRDSLCKKMSCSIPDLLAVCGIGIYATICAYRLRNIDVAWRISDRKEILLTLIKSTKPTDYAKNTAYNIGCSFSSTRLTWAGDITRTQSSAFSWPKTKTIATVYSISLNDKKYYILNKNEWEKIFSDLYPTWEEIHPLISMN